MKELILDGIHLYNGYSGTGMYMALYIVSLIVIALCEQEKDKRIKILYPAILVFVYIFIVGPTIDIFVMNFYNIWTGPRQFWPLFSLIVVAYIMTRAVQEQPTTQKKKILLIALVPLIFFSGEFKLSDAMYQRAENIYRIPQYGIEMCETVLEEKEEPKLLVPYEIAHLFRQYSTDILLLYGENATYGRIKKISGDIRQVCTEMDSTTPDIDFVLTVAKRENCDFVVFDMNYHELDANPEDYGYAFFKTIEHYDIYMSVY